MDVNGERRRSAVPFLRAAEALAGGAGGWRVEQVRFERRCAFEVEGKRWVASMLLACVERPPRGGRPGPILLNAHVHLWPPRLAPSALRRASEAGWLREERERFAARGWGVSWDPATGRFGWVARPLEGDLTPLVAERDFLEGAFSRTAGGSSAGPASPGASVAEALAVFRGRAWIPSVLGLARRDLPAPEVGGRIGLAVRLLGPPPERRSSARPLRAEASLTLWPSEAAGAVHLDVRRHPWLRRLVTSGRAGGLRARWHLEPQGQRHLELEARIAAAIGPMRRLQRLLDGLVT